MANLPEIIQYDAGVYQLETVDPVQGGVSGISNAQGKNLANRTAWLKKHVDDIESGATIPPGIAVVNSQAFTGTPTVPTAALGDRSLLIANTTFVKDVAHGMLSKSVAGGANVTLTANEASYAILVLTGALTANIDVIVPATAHNFVVSNATSGAFTLRIKTAAGTGVYVKQGKNLELICDGTNVQQSTTDFTDTALLGSPTAPSPTSGTNSTAVATTAFVANAIDGVTGINVAGGANVTVTSAQAGTGILNLTGAITADINLVLPTASGQWIIANNSTGGFNITAKMATGTGVVLPQGLAVVVYSDGTNVYLASSGGQNSFSPKTFTPTAGTTSLSVVGGYTPGNVLVEKNGVMLGSGDFTATVSPNITLNTATIAGDKITVYVFSSFQVANAVQKSGDTMGGPLALAAGSTAPTPVQFTNDTSVATAASVKQSGIQHSGPFTVAVTRALTAAESIGNMVIGFGQAAPITLTLPSITACPDGGTITFFNAGGFDVTISRAGTEAINPATATVNSVVLKPGDTLLLSAQKSAGVWDVFGGSAQLPYAPMFASSKTANGYQKLPSGLIVQWGTITQTDTGSSSVLFSFNLPIAFPTAALQGFVTASNNNNSGGISVTLEGISTTVANGYTYAPAGSRTYRILVIGY